jgi:hypothetical protein
MEEIIMGLLADWKKKTQGSFPSSIMGVSELEVGSS